MLQCELNDKKKTKPFNFSYVFMSMLTLLTKVTMSLCRYYFKLCRCVSQTKHKCWEEEISYQINPSFLKSNSWVKLEGCPMMNKYYGTPEAGVNLSSWLICISVCFIYSNSVCFVTVTPLNVCHPNPCYNGGSCHENNTGFVCSCLETYTGPLCKGESTHLLH